MFHLAIEKTLWGLFNNKINAAEAGAYLIMTEAKKVDALPI